MFTNTGVSRAIIICRRYAVYNSTSTPIYFEIFLFIGMLDFGGSAGQWADQT